MRKVIWWFVFAVCLFLSNFSFAQDVLLSVSNDVVNLKYNDAIVKLEDAISKSPSTLIYYPHLIDLLFKVGNLDLAKKYIDMMSRYSPNGDVTLAYRMEYLRRTGNVDEAFGIAKELLSRPSMLTNQDFLVFYSRLLAERNLTSAKVALYKYIQVFPNNYKLNLELAKVLIRLGEINRAKERLDYSLTLNRFNKEVYSLYGEYFFLVKDYNKAIDNLLKAIIFPEVNSREYYLLLECYYRLGKYSDALKWVDYVTKDERVKANLMFLNKQYENILKKYQNSKDDIIRLFVEESSILLDSDFKSKDTRVRLSDARYSDTFKLRKNGSLYLDFYYRRAIRLNPENYRAWYDLVNYYVFSYSKYVAFDELRVARNIVNNDEKLQNLYSSLVGYVSNVSKLRQWDIELEKVDRERIFVNLLSDDSVVSTNSFILQAHKWAWEYIKIPYFDFTINDKKVNLSMLDRSYSLFLISRVSQVGNYLRVDVSIVSPADYSELKTLGLETLGLQTLSISVNLNEEVVSQLSYLIGYYLRTSILDTYGKVLGSENNDKVVGIVMNGNLNVGDKVVFTDSSEYSLVPLKKYRVVAEGTVIDKDGEYVLVQLDMKYRYLTKIFNKTIFLKGT